MWYKYMERITVADQMNPLMSVGLMLVRVDEYNRLQKENADLGTQLAQLSSNERLLRNQKKLFDETIKTREEIIKAREETIKARDVTIEELRCENSKLKAEIESLKAKVHSLETQEKKNREHIDYLLKKESDRTNMMLTSEVISLFDRTIVKHVFGEDRREIRMYHLITNKVKLGSTEESRWKKVMVDLSEYDPDSILSFFSKLQDDRNHESHAAYQDPRLTISQIKQMMYDHVQEFLPEESTECYPFIDFLLDILPKWTGDRPFKRQSKK